MWLWTEGTTDPGNTQSEECCECPPGQGQRRGTNVEKGEHQSHGQKSRPDDRKRKHMPGRVVPERVVKERKDEPQGAEATAESCDDHARGRPGTSLLDVVMDRLKDSGADFLSKGFCSLAAHGTARRVRLPLGKLVRVGPNPLE